MSVEALWAIMAAVSCLMVPVGMGMFAALIRGGRHWAGDDRPRGGGQ